MAKSLPDTGEDVFGFIGQARHQRDEGKAFLSGDRNKSVGGGWVSFF